MEEEAGHAEMVGDALGRIRARVTHATYHRAVASETVHTDRSGGVTTITLDRPAALNALDLQLAQELRDAARRAADDVQTRCIVLTGAGKAFCAGGDIAAFVASGERVGDHVRQLSSLMHEAEVLLARADKPVIVAVNGAAAGGGFGLAVCGDIVLAAESARFTPAYTRIGAAPDGGFTSFVPRLVGLRRAQELYYLDRSLTAREALDWGLVTRVVADAELASETVALAARLAAGPTHAFALAKRLFYESAGALLEAQLERESLAISESARSADWANATRAFLEKRKPDFSGS